MKLDNPFTKETRFLFEDSVCFVCGLGRADALHHIKGRETNSPLNACPVHNQTCHFEIGGKLGVMSAALMRKTIMHLFFAGYRLTKKDIEFIDKYKTVYTARVPISILEGMGYPH